MKQLYWNVIRTLIESQTRPHGWYCVTLWSALLLLRCMEDLGHVLRVLKTQETLSCSWPHFAGIIRVSTYMAISWNEEFRASPYIIGDRTHNICWLWKEARGNSTSNNNSSNHNNINNNKASISLCSMCSIHKEEKPRTIKIFCPKSMKWCYPGWNSGSLSSVSVLLMPSLYGNWDNQVHFTCLFWAGPFPLNVSFNQNDTLGVECHQILQMKVLQAIDLKSLEHTLSLVCLFLSPSPRI